MIRSLIILGLWFFLAVEPELIYAQNNQGMRQKHSWGRCQPGAWKQVRVKTETLDEKGQVVSTSVTETLTTLEAVTEKDFTLRIEVVVNVAGKQFSAQPQIAKQGFNGECEGQKVAIRKVGGGAVTVAGRSIPCETREVVINGSDSKRTSLVHFSENTPPFVLKRETTATDPQGKVTTYQTQVEVVALDVPQKVLTEMKNTTHLKTVYKQPKASIVTMEVHCDDVPGGVVAHTSQEEDEKGRTLRRSTLELIDYGKTATENDPNSNSRRRLFHRNRGRAPS